MKLDFLFFLEQTNTKMHEKSLIWGEKHQISGLVYLGLAELMLDRSKTLRDVFVGKT